MIKSKKELKNCIYNHKHYLISVDKGLKHTIAIHQSTWKDDGEYEEVALTTIQAKQLLKDLKHILGDE